MHYESRYSTYYPTHLCVVYDQDDPFWSQSRWTHDMSTRGAMPCQRNWLARLREPFCLSLACCQSTCKVVVLSDMEAIKSVLICTLLTLTALLKGHQSLLSCTKPLLKTRELCWVVNSNFRTNTKKWIVIIFTYKCPNSWNCKQGPSEVRLRL